MAMPILAHPRAFPATMPAGVREQMRKLLVTRFMFFASAVLMLFMVGVFLVMWIETKRPDKDNAALYVIIFGFITTNVGVLLANAKGDRVQDTLQSQNIVMDEVHQKVNGGQTRLIEAMKAEHDAALAAVREELKRERNDLKGEKQHLLSRAELAEQELRTAVATTAKLEAQVHDLTDKLTSLAHPRLPDEPC